NGQHTNRIVAASVPPLTAYIDSLGTIMETPPAIADLGPFEYDSKFRTWTARGLLRGSVFTGDVQFGVFSSAWPPPPPDDRMRQAFDQCRHNWGTLETRARTHVLQAFHQFAIDR